MQPNHTPPAPAPSFNLGDIYFLVFRHKWKILLCVLLGFSAAAWLYVAKDRVYSSEAKILVRYIADRASLNPAGGENVRSTDPMGGTILNSEIQIITSRDLAEDVAATVGADKILARLGGSTNDADAAGHIISNLKTEIAGKSSVIAIYYEHPDPHVAQLVLKTLVERYMAKHLAVHRSLGTLEFLEVQTDRLRNNLTTLERELHVLRTNSGGVSIDAAKNALDKQMLQLRETILDQEAELEARRALVRLSTNGTNVTITATSTNSTPPNLDVALYRSITDSVVALRTREIEMLGRFTHENPQVLAVRAQLAELLKRKQEMEAAHPQLALLGSASTGSKDKDEKAPSMVDPALEVAAYEARLVVLRNQWTRLRAEAASLDNVEGAIKALERRRAVEEENYRAFSTSLEKVKIDSAIDASKITTISVVQAASLPALSPGKRSKPVIMAAGGGIALGLILAFLAEFVINPTVKRPADFRRNPIPLMLSIPLLSRPGKRKLLRFGRKQKMELSRIESLPEISDIAHPMRPYFEALRDRLLVEFEGNKAKPKLIGVTSCSRGSGSSSIAAGVAAAISETGDGNVLLVDMNFEHGSAHQFFKGQPVCALHEAVHEDTRGTGQVQENLYIASINQDSGDTASSTMVPSKKIAEIMPKLRASDYDYIIFDMPPITPTSITFRMSGLMDKVMLVVQSESTRREVLAQASALLVQAKAKASTVLNRQQRHVPRLLEQELNGATAN